MSDDAPKSEGWLEALRRSGDSLLGLMQSRLQLFAVELQEEKLRAINLFIWLSVALALGMAGVLVVVEVVVVSVIGVLEVSVITVSPFPSVDVWVVVWA